MHGRLKPPSPDTLEAGIGAELDLYLRHDTHAPLALGLSGGGDSLALLHLVAAWAREARRPLLALTVDHNLSPDSPAWTERAREMATAAGAEWRSLTWTGPKPATGLPAAARQARHRLLAEAAREAGAAVLLLAHTADDIAEGQWMRETGTAPTLGRLRPWSPSPVWPEGRGVFLLRPLLATSRVALRTWLTERGLAWLDDPANTDLRFARPRARRALAGAEPRAQPMLADDALAAFARATHGSADGAIVFEREDAMVPALWRQALAIALLCAGGDDRPPSAAALGRLAERLATDGAVATLAGARVSVQGDQTRIARDPGRKSLPVIALTPGAEVVWDGRFAVTASTPGWTVAMLSGHAARLPPAERNALRMVDPAARPVLPAFHSAVGEVRLAPPFGAAPAEVRPLALERLHAACGLVSREP